MGLSPSRKREVCSTGCYSAGAAGEDGNARYFGSTFGEEFVRVPFNDLDALERALRGKDVALLLAETLPERPELPW